MHPPDRRCGFVAAESRQVIANDTAGASDRDDDHLNACHPSCVFQIIVVEERRVWKLSPPDRSPVERDINISADPGKFQISRCDGKGLRADAQLPGEV